MSNAIFMKIEGIEGESQDMAHAGWIRIEGFSHNVATSVDRSSMMGSGDSRRIGAVQHGDLRISKVIDSSSLPLMDLCCHRRDIETAELKVITTTMSGTLHPLYQIKLWEVIITSINISDSFGQGGRPVEEISLNYSRIEWEYNGMDDMGGSVGTITKYWDFKDPNADGDVSR